MRRRKEGRMGRKQQGMKEASREVIRTREGSVGKERRKKEIKGGRKVRTNPQKKEGRKLRESDKDG